MKAEIIVGDDGTVSFVYPRLGPDESYLERDIREVILIESGQDAQIPHNPPSGGKIIITFQPLK